MCAGVPCSPPPSLAIKKNSNPFSREDRVVFQDGDHTYLVDGIRAPRSVTGLIHSFANEFDPVRALRCMKLGRNWQEKRQYMLDQGLGISDEEILARWAFNGRVQSKRGQLLHFHAEQFMNGIEIEEPHSPEFLQFRSIYQSLLLLGLTPYRT